MLPFVTQGGAGSIIPAFNLHSGRYCISHLQRVAQTHRPAQLNLKRFGVLSIKAQVTGALIGSAGGEESSDLSYLTSVMPVLFTLILAEMRTAP